MTVKIISLCLSCHDGKFAKLPREIITKYGLKFTGVFCKYIKYDEYGHCFVEIEKQAVKSPFFSFVAGIRKIDFVAQKMRDAAFGQKGEVGKGRL